MVTKFLILANICFLIVNIIAVFTEENYTGNLVGAMANVLVIFWIWFVDRVGKIKAKERVILHNPYE